MRSWEANGAGRMTVGGFGNDAVNSTMSPHGGQRIRSFRVENRDSNGTVIDFWSNQVQTHSTRSNYWVKLGWVSRIWIWVGSGNPIPEIMDHKNSFLKHNQVNL